MRQVILDATMKLIRERGLAEVTTKEIARVAGCSEGALYYHFADKDELLLSAVVGLLPDFTALTSSFEGMAGSGTVRGNLTNMTRVLLMAYHGAVPIIAALFSVPRLLVRHAAFLEAQHAGPARAFAAVAAYIAAEQRLGRINPAIDPHACTSLLLGSCHEHSFSTMLHQEHGTPGSSSEADFVDRIVVTLVTGLEPLTR